ncbi:hypothetical protein CDN99_07690 [Roseateles aquatilis]|uniref:Uncharacterized protein n=1 Tax=Roseateles aquatilis TaxID=431061 RepID=A0A246JHW1_9BURK|nr:hypothetical protein [Roseateles aquatilis]OWQ92214.1 hypothetical protein CDN99_07690 [Roseateles aquatilis]
MDPPFDAVETPTQDQSHFLGSLNHKYTAPATHAFNECLEGINNDKLLTLAGESPFDPTFHALCLAALDLRQSPRDHVRRPAKEVIRIAGKLLSKVDPRPSSSRLDLGRHLLAAARVTLQDLFDETYPERNQQAFRPRTRAMQAHARAYRDSFGQVRCAALPNVDFILDAKGKVAYAFTAIDPSRAGSAGTPGAAAARAVPVSVFQRWMSDTSGLDFSAADAALVQWPANPAARDADELGVEFGVLARPPSGFELTLSPPPSAGHSNVDGSPEQRLEAALQRPLSKEKSDRLLIARICSAQFGAGTGDVLVDTNDRYWQLNASHAFPDDCSMASLARGGSPALLAQVDAMSSSAPFSPRTRQAIGALKPAMAQEFLESACENLLQEYRQLMEEALGKAGAIQAQFTQEAMERGVLGLKIIHDCLERVGDLSPHRLREIMSAPTNLAQFCPEDALTAHAAVTREHPDLLQRSPIDFRKRFDAMRAEMHQKGSHSPLD